RTGKEMKFIVEGVTNSAPADTTLIRLLVRGQKIAKRMFESNSPPLEAIAHEERITASYATRLVRLTFLAPDIVAAILAGKQPPGLTANKLKADTRLPLDWRDQRAALLSFAQFEREVTGERIRDKIAASKKKGMWMGG